MMIERRFIAPLIIGIIGYLLCALLAPRFDPTLAWNFTLDRAAAISRAREVAALFNLEANAWQSRVTANRNKRTDYYLSRHPASPVAEAISPIETSVRLRESGGSGRDFRADLTAAGRLVGFEFGDASSQKRESDQAANAPAPISPETARVLASNALARLAGDDAAQFALVSEVEVGTDGRRFGWERTLPGEDDLKLRITALVRGDTVREAQIEPIFSPAFDEEISRREDRFDFLEVLAVLAVLGSVVAVLLSIIAGMTQGEIDYPTSIAMFGLILVLFLVNNFFGGLFENEFVTGDMSSAVAESITVAVLVALVFAVLWGAMSVIARRALPYKIASVARLLRGKLLRRSVAAAVATGVVLGGVFAAIPHIVAALPVFAGARTIDPAPYIFVTAAPVVAVLLRPVALMLLFVYGFVVPLLWRLIRYKSVARLAGIMVGFVLLFDDATVVYSGAAAVIVAALWLLAADLIFWRYDLLTLLIAATTGEAVISAATLTLQRSPAVTSPGWQALGALTALLIVALVVTRFKRAAPAETVDDAFSKPLNTIVMRAERERLSAEFGVARQAQRRMLPETAPRILGYDISAVCRPAREVGGDLFDFITLPDERIGIVVADVSGKGVPAALYMTLTKGLLASIAENEADPKAILSEVNRHLYEVCRRKVFVTMILGVLDPATRKLTVARAGHNPGVWRRATTNANHLFRAPGLGLGLNSGKLFDASMRIETVEVAEGDAVVFYSDGITEAMNAAGEEYSEERLLEAIAGTDGMSAVQTQDALLADVNLFLGDVAPQDDQTIVVFRVER